MAKKRAQSNTPWIVAGLGLAGGLGYIAYKNAAREAQLALLQNLPIPTDALSEPILAKASQQLAALGYYNGPYVPGEAASSAAASAFMARNPDVPAIRPNEPENVYAARVITAIDQSYRRSIGV